MALDWTKLELKKLADSYKLSRDSAALDMYLRARLVQLTTENGTVAVKAVEMLLGLGASEEDATELANIPTTTLLEIRERAVAFVQSQVGNGAGVGQPDESV